VQGLKLFKKCKDVTVLCPFHEEKNQFYVLSPAKNPYHCFGCNASGWVIGWGMQTWYGCISSCQKWDCKDKNGSHNVIGVNMMTNIKLEVNEDGDMAYLYLPKHPVKGTTGVVTKQIPLSSIVADYQGPEVFLDFDNNGAMIGFELFLD
jgi:uncharacterized protein YuzE